MANFEKGDQSPSEKHILKENYYGGVDQHKHQMEELKYCCGSILSALRVPCPTLRLLDDKITQVLATALVPNVPLPGLLYFHGHKHRTVQHGTLMILEDLIPL
ncbi:unnamed protein product [Lupinus luteus]|uniref:Uncharacterized protein n=1 Tax=Lupinus luteus TaxID=3873 RepID=A0AAV1VS05_LUPLU